jgi:hypothetical protein
MNSTLAPIPALTGATSSLQVLKTVFAEDKRARGFSDVVRAAYAQILGQTPDPAS